jgi:hypothetical protein
MAGVQGAHCGHKTHGFSLLFELGHTLAQFIDGTDYFHCISLQSKRPSSLGFNSAAKLVIIPEIRKF